MYKYNHKQLKEDISRLVSFKGERKQNGFYTIGCLNIPELGISIVDPYISDPIVKHHNMEIDLTEVDTDKGLGQWLLENIVEIEAKDRIYA